MKYILPKPRHVHLVALVLLMAAISSLYSEERRPTSLVSSPTEDNVAHFVSLLRGKAKILESSSGMRLGFESFASAHKLPPESIRYSDYVMVRLLFEATRDAGFWNLHWPITDQPPNSDRIWKQWQSVGNPSPLQSTATAECDELSALYAFLVEREGVKSVGLLWPTPNHTVAVWVLRPASGQVVRVVVPTTQIFLDETDRFIRRSSIRGDRRQFTNTRAAMFRTRLSFPSPYSTSSSSRWTSMEALPTQPSNN